MIESFPSPPFTALMALLPTLSVSLPAPPLKVIPWASEPPSTLSSPPARLIAAAARLARDPRVLLPGDAAAVGAASISVAPPARWKMIAGGLLSETLMSSTPSVPW